MKNSETREEISHYDSIMAQQSISRKDLAEHLSGPVVALLAHLIIIPLCLTLVIMEAPKEEKAVRIEPFTEELKSPEPPPIPPDPPEQPPLTPTEVEVNRPPSPTASEEETIPDDIPFVGEIETVEMPNAVPVRQNHSQKVLPEFYANRSTKGRIDSVEGGGGKIEGQISLARGLNWLAEVQNSDGSWGSGESGYSPALTGMSLLAFLAQGHLPASPRYGEVVTRAIQYLVACSDAAGPGGIRCDQHQYGHAIVTYALAEAAAMTRIPVVVEAMDKCTAVIVSGMNSKGGFHYNYKYNKDNPNCDLSYGGWNYQALKAAFFAGSTVPKLGDALDCSLTGIRENFSDKGNYFFYETHAKGAKEMAGTMTPVGILCLQILGAGESKEAKNALQFMVKDRGGALMEMNWKTRGNRTEREYAWSLYAWYYQTQVLFQAGNGKKDDPNWRKWRLSYEKALIAEQNSSGYWESPAQKYPGQTRSFQERADMDLRSDMNLRVYSTALSSLMLEVYYRFLPSYHLVKDKGSSGNLITVLDCDEELIQID